MESVDHVELFFLVMLSVVSCRSDVAVDKCPPYDKIDEIKFLPDPHDCSVFRRCLAGKAIQGQCPPGQFFNPVAGACGDPAQSGCTKPCSEGTPKDSCRYHCTCSRRDKSKSCPRTLELILQMDVFGWDSTSLCSKGPEDFFFGTKYIGHLTKYTKTKVYFCSEEKIAGSNTVMPYFTDCTKYVSCQGESEGVDSCQTGEVFDEDYGMCNYPGSVICNTVVPPPGSCPAKQLLTSCPYFCRCKALGKDCPTQLSFGSSVNYIDPATHPACKGDPAIIPISVRSVTDGYLGRLEVEPNTAIVNYCLNSTSETEYIVADHLECGRLIKCKAGRGSSVTCLNGDRYNVSSGKCETGPDPCKDARPTGRPQHGSPAADPQTCPSAAICSIRDSTSRLPHPNDCSLFCDCVRGTPMLGACPPGLHFDRQAKACDSPDKANCQATCAALPFVRGGNWSSDDCTNEDSPLGTTCTLECNETVYTLVGSEELNCTDRGWYGTDGLYRQPLCQNAQELADAAVDKINASLSAIEAQETKAGLLFVLDESGSVKTPNFDFVKDFVATVVTTFPLSEELSSGVITFSGVGYADVDIGLEQTSTCDFLDQLREVFYDRGDTDLAGALNLAKKHIEYYLSTGPKRKVLILIITDGKSSTNAEHIAKELRDSGHKILTIGVADYVRKDLEPLSSDHDDGSKLFFGLPSFQVLQVVAEYLKTTYTQTNTVNCP